MTIPSRRGRPLRRRALLGGGAIIAAAAGCDGLLLTPRRLVTSDHVLGSGAASHPLRLVQISDVHIHRIGTVERQLLERLHETAPDVIVITGDALDRRGSAAALDTLLREFPRVPRMFAILGNWEYRCGMRPDEMDRLYGRHGIELLVNRSVTIEHAGTSVRITGLDDIMFGRPDAAAALTDTEPVANHLVLTHCPVTRDAVPLPREHAATFVLAGHTHGGQVSFCGIAPVLPRACGRYVAGWYRDGGAPLFVSRGIGMSLLPIRIGSTPELARFEWRLTPTATS